MDASTLEFLRLMPKVELHVHMEGTLLPKLRYKLEKKNGYPQKWSTEKEMYDHYDNWFATAITGSVSKEDAGDGFFNLYFSAQDCLREEEDFYELAVDFFKRQASANVRYMEVAFNPQAATSRGVPIETVFSAYKKAKKYAEENLNVHCSFIMAVLRTESLDSAAEAYEYMLKNHRDMIYGVGLDGVSDGGSLMAFDNFFKRAKADGFHTTAHVDSEVPNLHPQLSEAVFKLGGTGLDRLDHGTSCIDFPDLMDEVKRREIGVTSCPSVFRLIYTGDAKKNYFENMVGKMFEDGVLISIGSDDPPYFGFNWVEGNLHVIAEALQHTPKELVQWQENAIKASWAPEEIKVAFKKELDEFAEQRK